MNKIYDEIEKQGSVKKEVVLKNIRLLYLKEKGKYDGNLEAIRANADSIFERIQRKLWDQANEEMNEIDEKVFSEAIDTAIIFDRLDPDRARLLANVPQAMEAAEQKAIMMKFSTNHYSIFPN